MEAQDDTLNIPIAVHKSVDKFKILLTKFSGSPNAQLSAEEFAEFLLENIAFEFTGTLYKELEKYYTVTKKILEDMTNKDYHTNEEKG